MNCGLIKVHRTNTNQIEFITHRFWRKYTTYLDGPLGEVKGGERERETGPGAHLIRVYG